MNKNLIKNITFALGGLIIATAVLIFALVGDLVLKIGSLYLIILIITGLGSSIFFMFSSKFRDEPKKMLTVKLIAIGLAILFLVAFFFLFYLTTLANASDVYDDQSSVNKALNFFAIEYVSSTYRSSNIAIFSIFLAISALGMIAQVVNVVLCALWKEE